MDRISRLATVLVTVGFVLMAWGTGLARADWTTYHRDGVRSGVDTSSGSGTFGSVWTSPTLAGSVYGEPLIHNGLVIVATESDDVYALNEATGAVVWHQNVGTPVPAAQLPCGNITPTVGITSTPVIDPTTNRVFVVADKWDGTNASSIHHYLVGFNLADGSPVTGLPLAVDPPGNSPLTILQRTALALDGSKIIIGYGGNAGDCGAYHGWLVAAPETGGSLQTFEVQTDGQGGAIWGSGNGPAVDASGNIWASTGNGKATLFEYQESVLKLDANLNLLDHFTPSNWSSLDTSDRDIASSDPLLLPGGLVFQIGKAGVGYLLNASSLGGTDANPVFSSQTCPLTNDSSFGGGVYYAGDLYVACANGLRAFSLNTNAKTLTPVPGWQVHSTANGPPIVAGGLVWVTAYNNATLYGLNPATGQAVVTQTTPALEHFTTPSASDGKLFLSTGQTVQAYNLAGTGPKPPTISEAFGVSAVPVGGSTSMTMTIANPNSSSALTGVGFTDTLPSGLLVAVTPGATNTCGGTWSPSGGAGSVTLSGASVGASSTCSVSVMVTGQTAGAKVNTTGAVVSTEGGSGNAASATLVVGPPTVTSVSPSSGPAAGGTKVTINGSNFAAGATVAFGSNAGTSVVFVSATQLTAIAPANSVGNSVDVRVTTSAGTSATSSNDLYAYVAASPMTVQAQVSIHGTTSVTTPSFSTAVAGEVLVAFVSSDGPVGAGRQTATVTGAGLTWTLVKRANGQSGDAEVWTATAPSVLSNATVSSTASAARFGLDLTVVAMEGVKGIGASVAGSPAAASAPSVSLTTVGTASLVFAVGHDWDNAIARTLPSGSVLLDQWLNTSTGDTFWSQYATTQTGAAGSVVTANDTAPTTDHWNLVAVELLNSAH